MYTEITPCAAVVEPCGCGCSGDCGCSDAIGLERTRFFPRQLVGPDDLTQDQRWIRDKLRRHNRLLHGWGVVCGCNVTQATDAQGRPVPWTVCVEPGVVLGPFGDEIVVDCAVTFDVRTGVAGDPGPCAPPADPWCVDVRVERRPRTPLYLAIRYEEHLTRPIRNVAGCGCGCDDAECEYSRIRESFALGVLEELPASYAPGDQGAGTLFGGLQETLACSARLRTEVRPCPPCPTDPWVVLADAVADADGGLQIDPIADRRYVAAFGAYSFTCRSVTPGSDPQAVIHERLTADARRTLEAEHGGDLSHAVELDARALKGAGSGKLRAFLAARTIGEVAGHEREAFVRDAVAANVDATKAGQLWDSANEVVDALAGG